MLPHGVKKESLCWIPLNERSTEHDVAGMTAKMHHGRHLLELWYDFIKAVFMQYVNYFCRCFYQFFDMCFLESLVQAALICLK